MNNSIFGCIPKVIPKICTNCKFFIKDYLSLEFSKCAFFEKNEPEDEYEKKKNKINFLVSGNKKTEKIKPTDYFFCSTARDSINMCGIEGIQFIENI
jgi:hypothetical protein